MEELTDFACGIWENSKKEGETNERKTTASEKMRQENDKIGKRKMENKSETKRM